MQKWGVEESILFLGTSSIKSATGEVGAYEVQPARHFGKDEANGLVCEPYVRIAW